MWFVFSDLHNGVLLEPSMFTGESAGVPLKGFLRAQVEDVSSWTSVAPPPWRLGSC